MASQTLFSSNNYVQAPIIIVKIGDYEFGSYKNHQGFKEYPNYIQSLEVTKTNGVLNSYKLQLAYAVNEHNDPNYFEKVFSSVATSRKIEFTYGDAAAQNSIFRNELALITKVSSSFSIATSVIQYTVSAISQGSLGNTGSYNFPARKSVQPSTVLYEILQQNSIYGLQDLFPGMQNIQQCRDKNLIKTTDMTVDLDMKINIPVLDYVQYLVDNMKKSSDSNNASKSCFFVLRFSDDLNDEFGGPYFETYEVNSNIEHPEAYQIDIGYPNGNPVFEFNVEKDDNYSIIYDYQQELHPQEYVTRINRYGESKAVFAPALNMSADYEMKMKEADKSWWAKMTTYPIKASIKIRGLLRPTMLMSYLRLNVIFYGKKHIYSGLYMITKQVDSVGRDGFVTTLNLTRISGDQDQYVL